VLELKLAAERRLGELIGETVDHTGGGDRKSESRVVTPIRDLPQYQEAASVPEPEFIVHVLPRCAAWG